MSREEETRISVKNHIVRTPESRILCEIAISLGMIVDILKEDKEVRKNE